ncbi:MAG: hypothetical protein WA989_12490 [Henriciella sp.]|uniref:hypothetical protein n=1 Tax=Henriciella sp. TaxID=1968823 RepID=UPI003C70E698
MAETDTLYLIYLRAPQTPLDPAEFDRLLTLEDGLYLIASPLSRSKVYHGVKHATRPEALLVAPLADDPKFMGMEEGALKALRAGL